MEIFWQPGITLDEVEKQVIMSALQFYQGNRTHTANALGVSVRTIQNKLAKYNGEGHVDDEGTEQPEQQQSDVESPTEGVVVEPTKVLPKERTLSLRKRKEI